MKLTFESNTILFVISSSADSSTNTLHKPSA
jgi:hypothetical protein